MGLCVTVERIRVVKRVRGLCKLVGPGTVGH